MDICNKGLGFNRVVWPLLSLILLSGCTDYVVYSNQDTSGAPADWGKRQIYRMSSNGWFKTNISNRDRNEFYPDVRNDGARIVFRVFGGAVEVMNVDGSNPVAVPNIPNTAGWPRWSQGFPEYFLVYSDNPGSGHAAIWRIREDGSQQAQVTHPGPTETDQAADVLDDKHIVFDRFDSSNNFKGDLYLKYIWDGRPPLQLTNTPTISELAPIISHDKTMVAYRVFLGSGQDDQVHVAGITTHSGLTPMYTIDLVSPADINISGVDFSRDDTQLFISTQADDVPGPNIDRKQEVFRVNLDGSNQVRLSNNSERDVQPSSVP